MRKEVRAVKIALGMIIRSLDSEAELMSFVENARKFGHDPDCVIVAYTHQHDPRVEHSINEKIPLFAVDIKNPYYCREQMKRFGISGETTRELLECPVDTRNGLVPYGYNRMIVVIEAIMRGLDTVFFVDSDVFPKVLRKTQDGHILEEVDFFGAHLKYLNSGSDVTTGEYSGYNILPPALFDGMEDFLTGVQKPEMLEYWQTSFTHRSLVAQPDKTEPKPSNKILGGNVAIKLSSLAKLPPFFSSHYTCDGELFLCRGEDTVLGLGIGQNGTVCTDIGLNPLHDTYKNYPAEPDLRNDPDTQERFYYACTGWVGRNPLLNHILGNDLKATREFQRQHLERGLRALASYTSNSRFNSVMRNFEVSWDSLGRYINELDRVTEAWYNLMEGLKV